MVRTIVLGALAAAPKSRVQLETKLAAKGAPAEVVAKVLDRFEQVGLVDDAEFARSLVRSRQAGRGLAGRALRQELRRSGVDDETAAEALADIDPEEELARAQALVAKRLPTTRGLPTAKRISRLAGMLARKGYPSALTLQVIRTALAEESAADQDPADLDRADLDRADLDRADLELADLRPGEGGMLVDESGEGLDPFEVVG